VHPLDLAKYNELTGINDYNDNAEVKSEPAKTSDSASVSTNPKPFDHVASLADSTEVIVGGKPPTQKYLNHQFKADDTDESDAARKDPPRTNTRSSKVSHFIRNFPFIQIQTPSRSNSITCICCPKHLQNKGVSDTNTLPPKKPKMT
jgi:hypothetical protein